MSILPSDPRLMQFGKYVFSPHDVVSFRQGRPKCYDSFLSVEAMRLQFPDRVSQYAIDSSEPSSDYASKCYGSQAASILRPLNPQDAYVLKLQGGWCNGRFCDWIGVEDCALADFRYRDGRLSPTEFPFGRLNPRYWRHRVSQRNKFPVQTKVKGRVVVLNKPGSHNYFHWLTEVTPGVEMINRMGLADADAFVVDGYASFQIAILERLGISRDKIIQPHGGLMICADELVIASQPNSVAKQWMRERFCQSEHSPSVPEPQKRVFISRRNAKNRFIEREHELESMLSDRGFETYCLENLSLNEQVELFRNASCVVGVHGAGLANMIFAPAGTHIIEIMPERYSRFCYVDLSAQLQHHHRVVFASRGRKRNDLRVSLEAMAAAVDDADAESLAQKIPENASDRMELIAQQ